MVEEDDITLIITQIVKHINTPMSHAAGRLFDSFSTLLGLAPQMMSYEGQPAVRLEAAAARFGKTPSLTVPFSMKDNNGMLEIDWKDAFKLLIDLKLILGSEDEWAMAVHHSIAKAASEMVEYGLNFSKARTVALSGGVFMNGILCSLLVPMLEKKHLKVLMHEQTPTNDGGISLGQAVIAGE